MKITNLFLELGLAPPDEINAVLEMSLIESFLIEKGYRYHELSKLPPEMARQLMTEASIFASARLAEIETRYQMLRGVHGTLP
jgi:hypothetical protein